MSAWSEAAWVIRELSSRLQIEENVEDLIKKMPIVFLASKIESPDNPPAPDIQIEGDDIPKESVWFVTEARPGEGE